jgi:hypothetical protein
VRAAHAGEDTPAWTDEPAWGSDAWIDAME